MTDFVRKHHYATTLNSSQRSALKGKAHALKPTVQVGGSGYSETVVKEIVSALNIHELIKIQLPGQTDAAAKSEATDSLNAILPAHSHVVARIGRAIIIYLEKNPEDASITLKSL